MENRYAQLISSERERTTVQGQRTLTFEMLSDKGRIVTSSAFRRLQTKAQVFSLEKNAAVRSRLTHTLEVALYGQLIAEKVFEKICNKSISEDFHIPFVTAVENSCLLHDIGNPPFGHLGEFAIREWFSNNRQDIKRSWSLSGVRGQRANNYFSAFENFDGNPQGFRIVTKLLWLDDEFGLNLTYTLLASVIKYLDNVPSEEDFKNKIGFFETERDLIKKIWAKLDLKRNKNNILQRHPLVFIMEAADDIAYSSTDIEDAIEKNIISQSDFFENIRKIIKQKSKEASVDGDFLENIISKRGANINIEDSEVEKIGSKNRDFINFKIRVANYLVEKSAQSYVDNEVAILNGFFTKNLLDTEANAKVLKDSLKEYAKKYIYTSREAIDIELSGFSIIRDILNGFMPLLNLSTSEFLRLDPDTEKKLKYGELALESRLYTLLPNKHLLAYRDAYKKNKDIEPVLRTHLIVDYLSGMTDSHAVKIFHMINGTSGVSAYE